MSFEPQTDHDWMLQALAAAKMAAEMGEVPVGAVLVGADGQWLATEHNQPIKCHDPTAHAEIRVLQAAGEKCQNYRFPGSTLYVTLEPCLMCAGAMVHARIARVVFGCKDPKSGAVLSCDRVLEKPFLNHRVRVEQGLLASECSKLLTDFFRARR